MFVSEERRIAERVKEYIKKEKFFAAGDNIMLRNGSFLHIDNYRNIVSRGKINPNDAYAFVSLSGWISMGDIKAIFHYPFLRGGIYDLINAYLSKLGFYYERSVVPATGLKYVVYAKLQVYSSIQIVNLDTAVNNTNLRKIVAEVLGEKLVSGEKVLTREEYFKIIEMFASQRLFAGHNFEEAWKIVDSYYTFGSESRVKEVARITFVYYEIFDPDTICYETRTWEEIDCSMIKPG